MGRRRPGALFDDVDDDPVEEPEETAPSAPDDVVPSTEQRVDGSIPAAIEPPVPAKKERTPEEKAAARARRAAKAARDGFEETPRDRARRQANKSLKKLLKFFEDVADGVITPSKARMEANEELLEIALDKTPTAQPVTSKRNRILVGFAGAVPGRYPGGSSVLKQKEAPPEDARASEVTDG